jgi:hypothetical protein
MRLGRLISLSVAAVLGHTHVLLLSIAPDLALGRRGVRMGYGGVLWVRVACGAINGFGSRLSLR